MDTQITINPNVFYFLVILAGVPTVLLAGGGVAAIYMFLRSKSREGERAYEALPPVVQAQITALLGTVGSIVGEIGKFVQLFRDWTDRDPTTPADPVEDSLNAMRSLATQPRRAMSQVEVERLENYVSLLNGQVENMKQAGSKTEYPSG